MKFAEQIRFDSFICDFSKHMTFKICNRVIDAIIELVTMIFFIIYGFLNSFRGRDEVEGTKGLGG